MKLDKLKPYLLIAFAAFLWYSIMNMNTNDIPLKSQPPDGTGRCCFHVEEATLISPEDHHLLDHDFLGFADVYVNSVAFMIKNECFNLCDMKAFESCHGDFISETWQKIVLQQMR